jgi:CheY-like chemotaxis protein
MIVDKQARTREMIRNFLNLPSITVCECASGNEALACVRTFKPDWITVDVKQIGTDGFQSPDDLREAHPAAQVIIMTGYNEPNFHKLYNSVGRSALLEKKTFCTSTSSSSPSRRMDGKIRLKKQEMPSEESSEQVFANLNACSF